jgi:hypothetical protein
MNKPRTNKAMREYLKNHFRYNTMNSWNNCSSYARKVKLHDIITDYPLLMKAYDFLEVNEAFFGVQKIIRDFEKKYDYRWQMSFNGRNSGYIVLYQGGKKDSGYKTQCDTCDRPTYYDVEKPCNYNGCDGTLIKLDTPIYTVFSQPGKGLDDGADFDSYSTIELQDSTNIVWDFDKTVDACIVSFIDFVKTHSVEDKTVMTPKQIRVAVPAGE